MSGYYYPNYSAPEDADYDFNHPYPTQPVHSHSQYQTFAAPTASSQAPPHTQSFPDASQYYHHESLYPEPHPHEQHTQYRYSTDYQQSWPPLTPAPSYGYQQQHMSGVSPFTASMDHLAGASTSATFETAADFLTPQDPSAGRIHRSTSLMSEASSIPSPSQSDTSRCPSPNASEMARWGVRNNSGTWSCAYPGCTSRSTFNRGCDLRKHYKRHTKSLFCRVDGCPQASEGGFSSKKDRARHEAKHNPNIVCEWDGCDRLFSRQDNMVRESHVLYMAFTDTVQKDHVRRVHKRRAQP